jgi:uncharacterized membrane protein YhdT
MKHIFFTLNFLSWLLICYLIPNTDGSIGFFLVMGLIAIIAGWILSTID